MTTFSWTGNSADWKTAADWSPAGPANAATADAYIVTAGAYTVTIATGESFLVDSLTFAPATSGALALNGTLTLGGTEAEMTVSSGTVLLAGTLAGGALTMDGGLLDDTGAGVISSAVFLSSGTVAVASGKTLTLSGPVTWDGGDVQGPGTLVTTGTTTINSTALIDGGLTWSNSGTVLVSYYTYDDDNLFSSTLANTVINQAGGTFDLTGSGYQVFINESNGGAPDVFTNAGLLDTAGETGTAIFDATLNSTGTVLVSSGELDLNNGGTLGGIVTTTAGGVLSFDGGSFAVTGALTNGGTLVVNSGTVGFSATTIANTVELSSGTVAIASGKTLTLSGPVTWDGGDVQGPGTLVTTGTTTINSTALIDGGLTWSNSGTVLVSYYTYDDDNLSSSTLANTVINQAGGTFDLTGSGYQVFINESNGGAPDVFTNAGLLDTAGETGTAIFDATLNSTGTVRVSAGGLSLNNGGTLGGVVSTTAGSTLSFGGGSFAVNGTLISAGTVAVSGGTVAVAALNATIANALEVSGGVIAFAATAETVSQTAMLTGGTVDIASGKTLTLSGALTWDGGDVQGPGTLVTVGTTTIDVVYGPAYIDGGLTWTNSGTVLDGYSIYEDVNLPSSTLADTIINQATGTFDLTGSGGYAIYDNSTTPDIFTNAGLLDTVGETGTAIFDATLNSTGTVRVSAGGLSLNNGGTLGGVVSTTAGSTLSFGGGSFAVNGTLISAGTVAVSGGTVAVAALNATIANALEVSGGVIAFAATAETVSQTAMLTGGTVDIASGKTLTLSGALTWDGGDVQGPGTLVTVGTTTIDVVYGPAYIDGGLTWTNSGTVLDGYSIYEDVNLPSSTLADTIINQATGTFDLTGSGGYAIYDNSTTPDIFTNAGLLDTVGETGTAIFDATLNSTGTVRVSAGGLSLNNGGTLGGVVSTTAGSTLSFGGGSFAVTGALTNGGTLAVNGGTVGFSTTTIANTVELSGGTLAIASGKTLTLSGPVTWNGGDVDGPGTLATTGTTTLNNYAYIDGGLTWSNSGTVLDSGYSLYEDENLTSSTLANTVINQAGGTFDLDGSGGQIFLNEWSNAPNVFTNAGLLDTAGAIGTTQFGATLNSTGTVLVSAGQLHLDNGGTLGGIVATTAGGMLSFDGGSFAVTGALTNGGTLAVNGGTVGFSTTTIANTVELSGGTLAIASGKTLTLSGPVTWSYGDVQGPGTLATTGTTTINNTAYIDGGLTWSNSGTVLDSGSYIYEDENLNSSTLANTVINQAGGTFDLTGSGVQVFLNEWSTAPANFTNAGLLQTTTGETGTAYFDAVLTNTGTVTATHGILDLDAGGTLAGTIGGTGAGIVELDSVGSFVAVGTFTVLDAGSSSNDFRLVDGATLIDTGVIDDGGRFLIGNGSGATTVTIAAGASFDFTTNDGYIVYGGAGALANAGTIAKTGGTGTSTIGMGFTNTGTVDAAIGTLKLTNGVSGAGILQIETGATLEFASGAVAGSNTIDLDGLGATLKIDTNSAIAKSIIGLGGGSIIDLAAASSATAVINGDTLTITPTGSAALNFVSTSSLANLHLTTGSDGGAGTVVTLYNEAAAGAHTPEPVAFGNVHVGATAEQALTVANTAPSGGYTENLDATLTSSAAGFAATGSFSGLTGGNSNNTALTVILNTASSGAITGVGTLALASDGTGIDGFGTTALPTQTVDVTGAVYTYAAPELGGTTIALGATRVGDAALTGSETLADGAAANAYQESLIYQFGTALPAEISLGNGAGTIISGNSVTIGVTLSAGTAGNFTGTAIGSGAAGVSFISTGAGTSGLANTVLTAPSLTVNGEVFATAVASFSANAVNFGVAHVGQVVNAATLGVTNVAVGSLTDLLTTGTDSEVGTYTGSVVQSLGGGLADDQSGTVSFGFVTSSAGVQSGTVELGFRSHDSALSDVVLSSVPIAVTGTLYNYATASAASPNPVNFGERHVGDVVNEGLSINNVGAAGGFTENLDGSIGSATGSVTASGSFTGLTAGSSNSSGLTIGLNSGKAGVQSGTAVVALTSDGAGVDTLGTTALTSQTIAVIGTLYNYATASAASPNPVNFGEHHVGNTLSQALSISNTGSVGGFTENLDGSIGGATGSVTASGSFTGLVAGSTNNSGLTIGLNSGKAGVQSGTAVVALTSDGAGIDTLGTTALASQTIAVTGTLYNYATASAASPNPVNFGEHHVGNTLSQALSISNTGSVGGFTENLDGSIGGATGSVTASGSFTGLVAGSTNNSGLTIGLNSGKAGVQSGTAVVALTSDGAGIDTLGTTALASQTIAVTGTLYNYATASAASPNPVNFGEHHVGNTLSQALSISNTGSVGGFTENLDGSIGGATGSVTASGSFTGLVAGGTNNSGLTIGLNSGKAGVQSGTAVVALTSDGAGIDTLGTTALASQTIAVTGTLYNYATASAASPNPVNFGEHHVGNTLSQALSISNTGSVGGFTENLDGSIGGATGSVTASGSFTGLVAGSTNNSGLTIGLNSGKAGVQSGTAVVALTSDGAGIDTLGTTALASQTIAVTGTLYNYATASAASPNPVNFGEHHVGNTLSQALSISNTGSVGGFTENLDGSIGGATGSVTASGSFTGLVAGGTNNSGLTIGLNSGKAGVQSGTAVVALTSDGAGIDTLGTTALASQTIAVTGTLYNYATASAASPNPVNFGEHHVGNTLSQALSISNTGSVGGFTENLDGSIGGATGSVTASGSFTGLVAGSTNNSGLTIGLNSGKAGVQSGTAVVALTSDGAGIDTLGTTALASQTIAVTGTLYNYATASAASPNPVNFGEHHVGNTLSQALSISNTGSVGGFTENLDGSIGGATGSVTASGSFTGLVAGSTNNSGLTIGLNSGKAGVQSGTAVVALTSDGAGIDTLGTTALASQTIAVTGTLYNYATASAASPNPVNFGEHHVGNTLSQALSISNTGSVGGFTENLDGSIGGATGSVTASGSFTGLAAGGTNNSGLTIGLNSGKAGVQSGTAVVALTSDGAGIDTLGTTALTSQTITVAGTLYNYATANASPNPVNFGIVHVGATVDEMLSIGNTGSVGSFTENLDGSITTATGGAVASGSFSGLVAGATNTSALSVGVNTATAGTISGTATIKLTSDGTGIDTLGTTALTSQTVAIDAIVNNYATAVVEDLSGGGTLTQTGTTYTLALGTIDLDTTAPEIELGIGNAASGPADLLSGGFVVSGDGSGAFTNTLTSFSGVTAGGVSGDEGISLSTSTGGAFSEQVTLVAIGTNSSGYLGALSDEVITVTGTVVPAILPPRTLVWTGASDTNLANASNWDDTTLGLDPATSPPSAIDTAEFVSNGGIITGTGTAATALFGSGAWHLATGGILTTTGSMAVGTSQDATLLIDESSSVITDTNAVIADVSGASGSSVTVTGSGSNWEVGGSLGVGDAATGQLSIDAGATVTAATLDAGVLSGSAGIVTVTDASTNLTTAGSLSVGDGGSGELSVLNGANVFIGGDLDIGQTAGGSGNVDIEDTTGTIYIGGNINIGAGGPGGLIIGPNATVELDNGGENIGADAAVTLFSLFDPVQLNNASLNTSFSVSGTQTYKAYVNNTGAITINSGYSIALDTPIIYGAGGAFNIDGGSTLVLNTDTVTGQTINFNGNGTLVIGSDQLATIDTPASGSGPFTSETNPNYGDALIGHFDGTINNFAAGDVITVDTTGPATFSQNGSIVSVIENGSTVGVLTFATPEMAQTAVTSDDLQDNALCFLAGTMIATPAGETAVERLEAGDLVLTAGGQVRPIVWVGQGRVLATKGRRNAATPVIVRKGALGPNIPGADLRVTKGHSLYLDGVLIPVEFLVNHRSIQWDDRAQEVSVYHVELETHDVLVANGAAAESYRDDGNRWLFGNANSGWDLPAKAPCAPVLTGGPVVDAAWRRLLDLAGPRPGMPLTDDPDLHLVVDGVRVDAQEQRGTLYVFRLPSRPTTVAIASRAGVPAELGIVRDPRSLGVAVRQVTVRQGAKFMQLDADDKRLTSGFHEFEPSEGLRWTTGYAELPAEAFTRFDNGAEVMLRLAGSTHYIEDDDNRAVA